MSLTTRLSAFFLAALALVLVGFSATLYFLAWRNLHVQVQKRLDAAFDTLIAATEIDVAGLEWEPQVRHLTLGQDPAEDQVRWLARDRHGKIVDRSANLGTASFLESTGIDLSTEKAEWQMEYAGKRWRIQQRIVHAPPPGSALGPREADPAPVTYETLVFTGGLCLAPIEATLRLLALALTGLSLTLWLAAVILGRWLCRRALRPLNALAGNVRAMKVADWEQRLPIPETGDELEDLGKAFNDLLARLGEAFERQRQFTGDASHQLRTPLTAMLGQIEVSLRRERSADEYRQVLNVVHTKAGHLRQIVEMLLFLARADAEAKLPNLELVNLTSWLADHLGSWSEHPRASDIHLEGSSSDPVEVRAQPPLLGQLLDNLLDNACKYSDPGTPIVIRTWREFNKVVLAVADQGRGIGADDLPHVFEPFYRSVATRRVGQPGVGLGLAVVQRIAATFGGAVSASSEPGRGTTIIVELPAATRPVESPRPVVV